MVTLIFNGLIKNKAMMKILNFALILLVVFMGLPAKIMASTNDHAKAVLPRLSPALETKVTLDEVKRLERMKTRLNLLGLAAKNRPHLFSLIEQQKQAALSKPTPLNKVMGKQTHAVLLGDSAEEADRYSKEQVCESNDTQACPFFAHLGFAVLDDQNTNEAYLVASAMNSEILPTNYTVIDLMLVNEHEQAITEWHYEEFFGDDTQNRKRKLVQSKAAIADALAVVQASEYVYADAWVVAISIDEQGLETLQEQHSRVAYSQAALLAILESASQVDAAKSVLSHIPQEQGNAYGKASFYPFTLSIDAPVDWRSIFGDGVPDDYITICLNRDDGDCDYSMYDPQDPSGPSELLRIPFKGELTVSGEVIKLYKPTDVLPSLLSLPTNIYLQTKENGGATRIGDIDFIKIDNMFADHITIEYDEATNSTKLSWNIPQTEAAFGQSAWFHHAGDVHWFMNFALEVKVRPNRPSSPIIYAVSSFFGVPSSDYFNRPIMRIVY